ncbi:MAG: CvpA family protein [Phycisphaerae bacterium]|jgi:hypothetical protein
MALSIFVVLLVLGITFMHSIFGLFSGLIDLLCCVSAMVVAFGLVDQVNDLATQQGLAPSYTLPVCFVLLFAVTHTVLRLAADNLLRGNVRLPMYVDWVGGAVCGFLIGMISVGVLVLGFLMLPWGGPFESGDSRVAGYSRYQRTDEPNEVPAEGHFVRFQRNNVGFFLRPDEFTIGLFNLLSNGSLKGETTFASVYPDYSEWVFWTGNTVQDESAISPYRDDKADGWGDKGITITSWWWQKDPVNCRYRWKLPTRQQKLDSDTERIFPRYDYEPGENTDRVGGKDTGERQLLGMRLKLHMGVADRAEDGTPMHRFRSTMFRVVGEVRGEPRQYHALILGGVDPGTDMLRLADIDNNFAIPAAEDPEVDAYFEVDEGFQPHFVEYRRFARTTLPADLRAEAAPSETLYVAERGGRPRATGWSRFIDAVIPEGSGELTTLPFPMNRTAMGAEAEFVGDRFQSGRIAGPVDSLRGVGPGTIREIAVPQDQRLFQLRCRARRARTLAGQVFNFVSGVTNQYQARDGNGAEYPLAGYYGIVKRDGKDYIELYLVGEIDAPAFRGMLDFKDIDIQELRREDSIIGLLFFVRPGTMITEVSNQGGSKIEFEGYLIQP